METIYLENIPKIKEAIIYLDRPNLMNAISTQMAKDILSVLDTIEKDDNVWAVAFTGRGNKSFCVGADLKERETMSKDEMIKQRVLFIKLFSSVCFFPKPIIAAVNGYALGGGFELALACDFIVSSEKAVFGFPEVKLGIIPAGGGTQNLSRLIGKNKTKELIFTGKNLTAKEALELGIVNKVLAPEELINGVKDILKDINSNGPIAIRQVKKSVNYGTGVDLNTGLVIEGECYNACLYSEDRDEGLRAFNEKRLPKYRGR